MSSEIEPRIYVSTISHYNSGSTAGAWVSLDEYPTAETFDAAARELHKEEHSPVLIFQDYQGIPGALCGTAGLDNRLWKWLALSEHDREVVDAWMRKIGGDTSILNIFASFLGRADSWEAYVDNHVQVSGMLSGASESLKTYFDYAEYGRELADNHTVAMTPSGVYVFEH